MLGLEKLVHQVVLQCIHTHDLEVTEGRFQQVFHVHYEKKACNTSVDVQTKMPTTSCGHGSKHTAKVNLVHCTLDSSKNFQR